MKEIRVRYELFGTNAERVALNTRAVVEGEHFFETDTGTEYIFYGGQWLAVSPKVSEKEPNE